MIWYEQTFDKPDGTAILSGHFHPDATPPNCIVTITLDFPMPSPVVDGETLDVLRRTTRILYSHNPSVGYEEPTADEVRTKYAHRLRKAIEYVQKQPRCEDMMEKVKGGRS